MMRTSWINKLTNEQVVENLAVQGRLLKDIQKLNLGQEMA